MKKENIYKNHSLPSSRREFLSRSFSGVVTSAVLPSLGFQLLNAIAPSEVLAAAEVSLPILTFDLAGGAGLSANFLVGGPNGSEDLLPSYDLLGWDPKGGYKKDFGISMTPEQVVADPGATNPVLVNTIYGGIMSELKNYPEAAKNFRMGSFCNFSRDDTSSNALSVLQLISKVGLKGTFIRTGVGTSDSLSGGNSLGVLQDLSYKPLRVSNAREIINSLSMGNALKKLKPTQVKRVMDGIKNLSEVQKKRFEDMTHGPQISASFADAVENNKNFAGEIQGVDPRFEAATKMAYGINEGTSEKDAKALVATIVLNVLKGNTGPGAVTVGGCDYHDGTAGTGAAKDFEVGQNIGRAVATAHLLGKPLFIHIVTDGSVYPKKGTRIWLGDAGEKSLTVIGIYDPKGPREMKRTQVGYYTKGQGVDRGHLIGADPAKVTYAVLANYLSAQGQLGLFESVASNIFSKTQLESVLIF